MDPNLKLTATDGDPLSDSSLYRRLIGWVLYLTISQPYITFAIDKLSQFMTFMSNPCTSHLSVVHHLLHYLKSTPDQGILFSSKSSIQLQGYSDVDWGTCPDSCKSAFGVCMFLGNPRNKAPLHALPLRHNTGHLQQSLVKFPSCKHCSKTLVFKLIKLWFIVIIKWLFHERMKHIEIDCHFIKENVL